MNREERERMVDRLLNQALAPQDVEPREGLEGRILANLRAQPEPRRWWKWAWALAAVGAAVVLLIVILKPAPQGQPTQAPVVAGQKPAPPLPAPLKSISPAPAVAQRKPARAVTLPPRAITVAAKRASQPRLAVFPSPTPLTPEEKMLLTLLQRNPSEAVLVAREQAMEWERVLKTLQTEETPSAPAEDMR
jgi:hypothetical protein